MSIFGSIVSAIFGSAKATEASPATPTGASPVAKPAAGPTTTATPAAKPAPEPTTTAAPGPTVGSTPAGSTPLSQIDVAAVLTKLAAQKREKLDWRRSIVDLMKLLDLDSSLGARKQLAKELNYTGNTDDSASMNIWLHKQVMIKLAASGGKVPDDLKS
jgi:hypothetical protein